MTHRVNAAVFRIGKSLNWHSLGSPLFRWRDLKTNLFLNYFLARFLEKENYRLVRYGVRSEKNILKVAIVAFRLTNTSRSLPRHVTEPSYETYWRNHQVYRNRFKLGVFRRVLQGAENPIRYPLEDAAGAIYLNESKNLFSIGPFWNWTKTPVFFMDGIRIGESEPGEAVPVGTAGFSASFYTRTAASLMVLRYAIKKSLLRVMARKFFPAPPKVFVRSKFLPFNLLSFENIFMAPPKSANCKKFFICFFGF